MTNFKETFETMADVRKYSRKCKTASELVIEEIHIRMYSNDSLNLLNVPLVPWTSVTTNAVAKPWERWSIMI